MVTRVAQLARMEKRYQAKLELYKRRLVRVHREQRQARAKRIAIVAALLDRAGLLWADERWLATQFQTLAALERGRARRIIDP